MNLSRTVALSLRNHMLSHAPLQCLRNSFHPLFNFKITLVIRPDLIIKFISKEVQLSPYRTFDQFNIIGFLLILYTLIYKFKSKFTNIKGVHGMKADRSP